MRGGRWVLAAVLAVGVTGVARGQERFTQPVGGSGGGPYALRCPPGRVLTGLTGRTGVWLDRIGPLCSGGVQAGTTGGNGGRPNFAACPRGMRVTSIAAATVRSKGRQVAQVTLGCGGGGRSVAVELPTDYAPEGMPTVVDFAINPVGVLAAVTLKSRQLGGVMQCQTGERIVGLHGRSGAWIDALGAICARV